MISVVPWTPLFVTKWWQIMGFMEPATIDKQPLPKLIQPQYFYMVSIFFQFSFWSHKQFIQNQQISCKLYLFSPVQFHEKNKI